MLALRGQNAQRADRGDAGGEQDRELACEDRHMLHDPRPRAGQAIHQAGRHALGALDPFREEAHLAQPRPRVLGAVGHQRAGYRAARLVHRLVPKTSHRRSRP